MKLLLLLSPLLIGILAAIVTANDEESGDRAIIGYRRLEKRQATSTPTTTPTTTPPVGVMIEISTIVVYIVLAVIVILAMTLLIIIVISLCSCCNWTPSPMSM